MYQANPDISPFDVRNIMQETAIYRQCHYLLANQPCPEDLIPKNRQNNVYGHGETRSPESVYEAANYVYGLDMGMNISLLSVPTTDNKIHIGPGEGIDYALTGDPVEVQWRTWDMRDTWMDLVEHDLGEEEVTITHTMLVDRLQELPDVEIEGNHTILLRSIRGPNASANMVTHIQVMGSEPILDMEEDTSATILALTSIVVLMAGLIGVLLIILIRSESRKGGSNGAFEATAAMSDEESVEVADLVDAWTQKLNSDNSSTTESESVYSAMTVKELKSLLSDQGMSTSGRKAELIQRLLNK
jgi:hypothetical protein